MPKIEHWERFIGHRLKLRDLHVFQEVARSGSMAKAAAQLGVSQPAVSEVIATLEHALRVRLLDRSARGVEPTVYGRTLLKRGIAAFDELKQGIRDIEALADPSAGELRVGCPESLAAAILPPVIQQFSQRYPRVVLHVDAVHTPTLEFPQLRARTLDLVVGRISSLAAEEVSARDLNVEVLYHDHLLVVAGAQSRWARRQNIDLADLVDAPWILLPPNAWNTTIVTEAFRARGLKMPSIRLVTYSVHLRSNLLATGDFVTVFPASVLHLYADRFSLKVLPVDLPVRPWVVGLVTLKNRTLSAVAERFVEHLRAYTKSIAAAPAQGNTAIRSSSSSAKARAGETTGNSIQRRIRAKR